MRIGLIGYGKMGREIARCAELQGIEVTAIIDPSAKEATARTVSSESLQTCDVCLDFSRPEAVIPNARAVIESQKPLVIGTTGWQHLLPDVKKLALKHPIGVLYGANFSIGLHLFRAILSHAARLMSHYPEYDVAGFEFHHRQKSDAPSGTARLIANDLLHQIPQKQEILYENVNRAVRPEELHFTSLRCGNIPGTHGVLFDSACDTIELRHTARSRDGLALGALQAAVWVQHRVGFFSIEEMVESLAFKKQDPP